VTNAYRHAVSDVVAAFGSDIRLGLSDDEAQARLDLYGRNDAHRQRPTPEEPETLNASATPGATGDAPERFIS
jgi:chromosome condensin MukBEF MukE localization factor